MILELNSQQIDLLVELLQEDLARKDLSKTIRIVEKQLLDKLWEIN